MAARAKQFVWDGQKSVDLDQYPAQAWTQLGGTSSTGNDSRADRAAAQNLYETGPVLFRCVELRQDAIARIPWAITRNGKDIWLDSEPKPPTALAYLKDFRRLLRLTEAALCLSPEAFWFVERNRVRPLALRWHSPSSVVPQWGEVAGLTGFKRLLGGGQSKLFEIVDYVYFSRLNPNHETIPGRPPAQAAMAAAGVLYNVDRFASAFFQRGAIKATLLTAPLGTSPTERDRLKAWWRRAFEGIGNAFTTEVVSAEVKPIMVGEGMESLSQSSLTREKKDDIATALGVPHSLLFSNAATYATARQDDVHFYDKTMIPSFLRIAEILNEQLLEAQGYALEVRPDAMSIFQADENERAVSIQALVTAGLPLDLALEVLGYDLTDAQWARVKTPPVPVVVEPAASEPIAIIDTPDKTAEIALLRRWARKRKHPVPSEFVTELLSEAEKAAIVAEVSGGTNFFTLTTPTGQTTRKNFVDDGTDGELEKRLEVERRATRRIAAGLKEQQEAVVDAVKETNTVQAAEQALVAKRTTVADALKRALLEGSDLGVSVTAAGMESVGFGMDWTLVNTEARDWAGRYAGELIRQVDATTLRQVQQAVSSWVENGEPLSRLVDDLAGTFGQTRARRIASTEVTRAYAYANRLAYEQSGVVEEIELRVSEDERVCPICGPRAGTRTSVRNPDFGGYGIPPLHVQCRCWLAPVIPDVQPRQARQPVDVAPVDYASASLDTLTTTKEMEQWAAARYTNIKFDFEGALPENIRPTMAQFDKLAKQYPEVVKRMEYLGTYKGEEAGNFTRSFQNAYAHASTSTGKFIGLNPEHYGNPQFAKVMADNLAANWTDGSGDLESLITHEFGHLIDGWLQTRNKSVFSERVGVDGFGVIGDTLRMWREQNKATTKLSQYATTNTAENFAEGFSAIYHKPKKEWPVFVKKLNRLLEEFDKAVDFDSFDNMPFTYDLPRDQRPAANQVLGELAKLLGITR